MTAPGAGPTGPSGRGNQGGLINESLAPWALEDKSSFLSTCAKHYGGRSCLPLTPTSAFRAEEHLV